MWVLLVFLLDKEHDFAFSIVRNHRLRTGGRSVLAKALKIDRTSTSGKRDEEEVLRATKDGLEIDSNVLKRMSLSTTIRLKFCNLIFP